MLFDCGIFLVCVRSLFYRLLFFSPLKKRLMSPENSTRKVNTILKCQEINDIVLSSYGSVGEGDKCLALFTPVPPYLWSFPLSPWLSLSPCLFLIYSSSTIFSPPSLPTPLLLASFSLSLPTELHTHRVLILRMAGCAAPPSAVVSERKASI